MQISLHLVKSLIWLVDFGVTMFRAKMVAQTLQAQKRRVQRSTAMWWYLFTRRDTIKRRESSKTHVSFNLCKCIRNATHWISENEWVSIYPNCFRYVVLKTKLSNELISISLVCVRYIHIIIDTPWRNLLIWVRQLEKYKVGK